MGGDITFAILFGAISGISGALAYFTLRHFLPLSIYFWWLTLNTLIVSFAYLWGNKVVLIRKDEKKGTIAPLTATFFLPFLTGNFVVWWLKHALCRKEDLGNEVSGGAQELWVGRYPLHIKTDDTRVLRNLHAIGVTCVVDLTCEFPAHKRFVKQASYFCCPSLDRLMASPETLSRAAVNVLDKVREPGAVYVHCANGHGRSALFAGILLILCNRCSSLAEAEVLMKSGRPGIKWQPHQEMVAKLALSMARDLLEEREREREREGAREGERGSAKDAAQAYMLNTTTE